FLQFLSVFQHGESVVLHAGESADHLLWARPRRSGRLAGGVDSDREVPLPTEERIDIRPAGVDHDVPLVSDVFDVDDLSMELDGNGEQRTARFDDELSAIDVEGSGELTAGDRSELGASRTAAGPAEAAPAGGDPVEVEAHG